jgi:broad specificity phosphatase PhoE
MKFYDADSEFTFGKYEGKTIKEIFEKDPKYIDFCFNNIDEFYVSPEVMKELKQLDPKFTGPNLTDLDDDLLESYLDEAEEIEDFDEALLEDEDEAVNWDDDDLDLGFDDDFESFDDFNDDDY